MLISMCCQLCYTWQGRVAFLVQSGWHVLQGRAEVQPQTGGSRGVLRHHRPRSAPGEECAGKQPDLLLLTRCIESVPKARHCGASAARLPSMLTWQHAQSGADIDDYIRTTLHSGNAVVGTCAMGHDPRQGAVVDGELRVHGTDGLRVVDASIIPVLPGTGPYRICTLMNLFSCACLPGLTATFEHKHNDAGWPSLRLPGSRESPRWLRSRRGWTCAWQAGVLTMRSAALSLRTSSTRLCLSREPRTHPLSCTACSASRWSKVCLADMLGGCRRPDWSSSHHGGRACCSHADPAVWPQAGRQHFPQRGASPGWGVGPQPAACELLLGSASGTSGSLSCLVRWPTQHGLAACLICCAAHACAPCHGLSALRRAGGGGQHPVWGATQMFQVLSCTGSVLR